MKVKDFYHLEDDIEHFVLHMAEEEFPAVKIHKAEIKKGRDTIIFNIYVERNDNEPHKSGRQDDLSRKLQQRVNKFHKDAVAIKPVEVNVYIGKP